MKQSILVPLLALATFSSATASAALPGTGSRPGGPALPGGGPGTPTGPALVCPNNYETTQCCAVDDAYFDGSCVDGDWALETFGEFIEGGITSVTGSRIKSAANTLTLETRISDQLAMTLVVRTPSPSSGPSFVLEPSVAGYPWETRTYHTTYRQNATGLYRYSETQEPGSTVFSPFTVSSWEEWDCANRSSCCESSDEDPEGVCWYAGSDEGSAYCEHTINQVAQRSFNDCTDSSKYPAQAAVWTVAEAGGASSISIAHALGKCQSEANAAAMTWGMKEGCISMDHLDPDEAVMLTDGTLITNEGVFESNSEGGECPSSAAGTVKVSHPDLGCMEITGTYDCERNETTGACECTVATVESYEDLPDSDCE